MPKTRKALSARLSQPKGGRRKKPTSRVERAFDEVKQLVSETGDRLLSRTGGGKSTANQVSAKKTASTRIRTGRQRQAAAKKVGASRIRSGKQRQAEAKKAARKRGVKTT